MDFRQTVNDAYLEGKKIMNRDGKRLGKLTSGGAEDLRFRSFFGAGVITVLDAWARMQQLGLLPTEPHLHFKHFLWALLFMNVYPKNEATLCTLCGGVDPKTARGKIWPFIVSLMELNYYVVSIVLSF